MKSPQQWKKLLESINFPNFNKSDNEEVMEFMFSNCKQRDALLTWIVIQLGANFGCRILKHEVIVEYLKKRRIAETGQIVDFVDAKLPKFDQEVFWDKLFYYVKTQKQLIPEPYEGIPRAEPLDFDNTFYTEKFHDRLAKDFLEPFYKELEVLKKLKRMKPSDVEASQCFGDGSYETKDESPEDVDAGKLGETSLGGKDTETAEGLENIKKAETNIGDIEKAKTPLPTVKTTGGTWYCSPDGIHKIFVPVGAPPFGQFNFDPKTMRVVFEEDKPCPDSKFKYAQQLEALERRLKNMMKEINDNS